MAWSVGNPLIIKHKDVYLSAYANHNTLLVVEGAKVDEGQAIAELGSVGSQACLHFEIRKNGSPVNPAKYLPEK
ncbi:MAG: murein hydrolase activator EnvC family protein [Methylomonas sp.]